MADRDVMSKTLGVSIPCDGPVDVQIATSKLEELLRLANKQSDVKCEFRKKPLPRAHGESTTKRSTKLRYK
jgi:hypothetical protein